MIKLLEKYYSIEQKSGVVSGLLVAQAFLTRRMMEAEGKEAHEMLLHVMEDIVNFIDNIPKD